MKKLIPILSVILFLASCNASRNASIKPDYTITNTNGEKILKGYINRSIIESDPAFPWFKQNMQYGQADATAVNAFKTNADKFKIIAFGGTWCHDTQNLLPLFYRVVDKSGYDEKNITLLGVDRAKTTINDLQVKYGVTRVPTFIVMHDGKEVGRVVEYGKTGLMEKELGEIVRSIK
jgi:thiol-disulfide isomerase/thioredoxin